MWASIGTYISLHGPISLASTMTTPVEKWPQIKDAMKVSDPEEVSDQDTADSNIVECEKSFVCCILIMYVYT